MRALVEPSSGAVAEERRVFGVLDGLRGVAAVSVAVHHLSNWWIPIADPVPQAGLAVDMFFVMSGFVLAHAYQQRLDDGMGRGAFMMARLVRLWPLYALGSFLKLLALAALIAQGQLQWSFLEVLASVPFAILFLPMLVPPSFDGHQFPLNLPAWSLFFELAVNLIWVAFLRRSRPAVLIAICALAAVLLVLSYPSLSTSFFGGAPRVFFSFFAGILSYHAWKRWPSPWRLPLWTIAIWLALPVVVFVAPLSGGAAPSYELAMIALFPAFIWASAKIPVRGATASLMARLGLMSYALY